MGRAKFLLPHLLGKIKGVWGERYTYISGFVDLDTPFKMYCQEHGEFETKYAHFVKAKFGCKDCNGQFRTDITVYRAELKDQLEKHKLDLEEMEASINVSKSGIRNTVVSLGLRHHVCGKLFTRALSAVRANGFAGCPYCPRIKRPSVNSTATFIEKAKDLNKRDYDYSGTRYLGAHDHITVHCNTHAIDFTTTPHTIYAGGGCLLCGEKEKQDKLELKRKTLAENKKKQQTT